MKLFDNWTYGYMLHYFDPNDRQSQPKETFFKNLDECFDLIRKESFSNSKYAFTITPGSFMAFKVVNNDSKAE